MMDEHQYQDLKRFMGLFYEWFEAKPDHPAHVHPVTVLSQIELESMSKAKRGLQMAINDCVEVSVAWSPEFVAEADRRFAEAGLPSLSKVRLDYSKRLAKLLKLGKLARIQDYYLVKGMRDSGVLGAGSDDEVRLRGMQEEFERSYSHRDR